MDQLNEQDNIEEKKVTGQRPNKSEIVSSVNFCLA